MKKIFVYILLIMSFVGNIYFIAKNFDSRKNEQNNFGVYEKLDSLLVDNFIDSYDRGETLNVYFGRPSCGDCVRFEPIFEELIEKYHLGGEIKYVNIEPLYENKLEWTKFKDDFNIKGTPTLAIYDNGKLVTKLDFEEENGFTINQLESWISTNFSKEIVEK